MGNAAGVRRDFEGLERRRMDAAELLKQGVSQSEVARRLGVHRQSVIRWVRQLAQAGRSGLKQAGRAGRKPKLSASQLRKIEQALKRGPEALGYASGLWTTGRVRELIEDQCGVRYHAAHVWRIMRQLGWSCQRPTGRALERDEEAIRYWKRVRWPQLKKSALRAAHHRLHRRKRVERAAPSGAHLGPARTDPDAAISFQLEGALGGRRHHVVELLFSALPSDHPRPAGGGLSRALAASSAGPTAGNLGSLQDSPQQPGRGICRPPAAPRGAGLPAGLSSGNSIRWSTYGVIGNITSCL